LRWNTEKKSDNKLPPQIIAAVKDTKKKYKEKD
jgi:hypothetical protein